MEISNSTNINIEDMVINNNGGNIQKTDDQRNLGFKIYNSD